MLQAGARCIGKTVTDELAFGLDGENYFYGTPPIPKHRIVSLVARRAARLQPWRAAWRILHWARIPQIGTHPGEQLRPVRHTPVARSRLTGGRDAFRADLRHGRRTGGERGCAECKCPRVAGMRGGTRAGGRYVHVISEGFECADEDVRAALDGPMRLLRERFGGALVRCHCARSTVKPVPRASIHG